MNYQVSKPAKELQPYIDSYFCISGRIQDMETITLLPEGGVNVFVNLGETIRSVGLEKQINHGGVYLVGTMLRTDVQIIQNEVLLFGVQFKPGGFMRFHRYTSLDQTANSFHTFPEKLFPDVKKTVHQFAPYLDQFYFNRLSTIEPGILNCVSDIFQHHGSLHIDDLAKKHFITPRQIERKFKQEIGLSPKKFSDLVRFRRAFSVLHSNTSQSIEDVAWNCGYYDHAHMTNDFRRFTGHPPSAFILSDFSKVIADSVA